MDNPKFLVKIDDLLAVLSLLIIFIIVCGNDIIINNSGVTILQNVNIFNIGD